MVIDLIFSVEVGFAGELCGTWNGVDSEHSEQALQPTYDGESNIDADVALPRSRIIRWELPVFEAPPTRGPWPSL